MTEKQETYPWWDLRAYEYDLPKELIAQQPAPERDRSRLIRYSKAKGTITEGIFKDIVSYFKEGDVLVLNNCKVIPARLYVKRADTGTKIELLLTKEEGEGEFVATVRPGHSCKTGVRIVCGELKGEFTAILPDGQRRVRFEASSAAVNAFLEKEGTVPLPPYIERPKGPSEASDRERYQTVYAKSGRAVAAPTAGLHFTPEILKALETLGVTLLEVTLNVGLGTFKPVKVNDIRKHEMHEETFTFTSEQAELLNKARSEGRRIIAVGTTSLRVLESCLDEEGKFRSGLLATKIFIHPPLKVRSIDAIITNFHLPKSTLLMLVAALIGDAWKDIYQLAVRERYRFFSYGDCMLLEDLR